MKKLSILFFVLMASIVLGSACIVNVNDDPIRACTYTVANNAGYSEVACVDKKKSEGCPDITADLNYAVAATTTAGTMDSALKCSDLGYAFDCKTVIPGLVNPIYMILDRCNGYFL